MRTIGLSRLFCLLTLGVITMGFFTPNRAAAETHTASDFIFSTLTGSEPMPLAQYKGKVLLIVNTASQCGFTGQYDGLQKLYDTYKDQGLVVIGVPSDDFGHQEPGTNQEIAHFCKLNYGVTFPMAAKEDVVGDNAHPFYKWASDRFGFKGVPRWNFHKYLVDRSGNLDDYFYSTTGPDDSGLIKEIEKLLAQPVPSDSTLPLPTPSE